MSESDGKGLEVDPDPEVGRVKGIDEHRGVRGGMRGRFWENRWRGWDGVGYDVDGSAHAKGLTRVLNRYPNRRCEKSQ